MSDRVLVDKKILPNLNSFRLLEEDKILRWHFPSNYSRLWLSFLSQSTLKFLFSFETANI